MKMDQKTTIVLYGVVWLVFMPCSSCWLVWMLYRVESWSIPELIAVWCVGGISWLAPVPQKQDYE